MTTRHIFSFVLKQMATNKAPSRQVMASDVPKDVLEAEAQAEAGR